MEVLDISVKNAALLFNLNALFCCIAQVVFEKTRVFERLNVLGIRAQIKELVRKVMEPDDDELALAIELSNVIEALGIVADTELAVCLKGRDSKRRVLQSGVAHMLATRRPD